MGKDIECNDCESCKNCKYFGSWTFRCRRNPPVYTKEKDHGGWPLVFSEDDWCGEFVKKE